MMELDTTTDFEYFSNGTDHPYKNIVGQKQDKLMPKMLDSYNRDQDLFKRVTILDRK